MIAPRPRLLSCLLSALGALLAMLTSPGVGLAGHSPEHILAQTAEIRGLAVRAPVPLTRVDPTRLRQELLDTLERGSPAAEVESSRKLLVLLGLLSPDADLYSFMADAATAISYGYYNPQDKTVHVTSREASLGPREKLVLAHEFTHALQDQHFGLSPSPAGGEFDGDQARALTALLEGDANLTMATYARSVLAPEELIQVVTGSDSSSAEPRGDNLPPLPLAISKTVEFPYNEGFDFAVSLSEYGGYAAVNRAFSEPPRSTAQILHPQKYLAGQQPAEVRLPDLAAVLGPGWSQLRSDVLGELDVRIMLEQFSDPKVAAKAAEGWAGDRYALLENAVGQQALVISTAWDTETEAAEFFNAYADSLGRPGDSIGRRYGARARRIQDLPSKIIWATPNGPLLLQKAGPQVAVIMAPEEAALNSLAAAMGSLPSLVPAPLPPGR